MEQIELLTPEQKLIFDEVIKDPSINKSFYFTGGTALSGVYLKHRVSDDLDFFSEQPFQMTTTLASVTEWSKKLNFTISSRVIARVQIFQLAFVDGPTLKVDFAHYPFKRLEEGPSYNGLAVDSLVDIATNKLMTINQRTEIKDFVDLYFLLQRYTFWDLLYNVKVKFRVELDLLNAAADFQKIEYLETMPKMILPLELETLKTFYRDLAKKIGQTAVTD